MEEFRNGAKHSLMSGVLSGAIHTAAGMGGIVNNPYSAKLFGMSVSGDVASGVVTGISTFLSTAVVDLGSGLLGADPHDLRAENIGLLIDPIAAGALSTLANQYPSVIGEAKGTLALSQFKSNSGMFGETVVSSLLGQLLADRAMLMM